MNAEQAQLLATSNISWVSCDVTFNPADSSQWSQVYTLAKQYHLSVMGILDQHLMNYSTTFTLADWDAAVKQAIATYGDTVKTWEVWNEPSMPNSTLGYFDGSPQTYVTMLQTAYNDIKSVAPTDTIIGLGGMPLYDSENETINYYTQQALAWATQVVQLGGMNYCDAIAVHAYPYGEYFPEIAGESFTYYLQQYQKLCPNKPIWVTEVGQESSSITWPATPIQQSDFLAQSYSLFSGLDVKAYFWYELCDANVSVPTSNFGLFGHNGNPKPAFNTYVSEVNNATSPTATPPSSQNPNTTPTATLQPTPYHSQSSSTQPEISPTSSSTTKSIPEQNYTIALIAALALTIVIATSTLFKRPPTKRASDKPTSAA